MNIYTKFENCYGIPFFEDTFKFNSTDQKASLIYAPNGFMKTSFADTMKDVCNERESRDFFYPDRNTTRIVKFIDDNNIFIRDLNKSDILVIEPYSDNYHSENISVLLADAMLKKDYEQAHKEIKEKMKRLFINLDKHSSKKSSEELLSTDFGFKAKDIYDLLERLHESIFNENIEDLSHIKYGMLFTLDSEKILAESDVINQINAYIEQYDRLISNSCIFRAAFNHTSAEEVYKTLKKEGFFRANHKIILEKSDELLGDEDLKTLISQEKERIIKTELADEFEKIDSLLSSKIGAKKLRDYIYENSEIIPELVDIAGLKKKIWKSYLKYESSVFEEAVLNYQHNKERIAEIALIAKAQTSKWHDVVSQFNDRFSNMPFRLEIANLDDVVLNSQMPAISFEYSNRGVKVSVQEKELISRLSNGEKKALYLLNVIFEIMARKELGIPTLLIIDDIADSFDYRNKYSIIEYLKDLADDEFFMPIILTHNFDFYRTVAGRVGIMNTSKFAVKTEKSIVLEKGQYFKNVFEYWKKNIYRNNSIFISSIAFIRNIVEYTKDVDHQIYKDCTSILHYKKVQVDSYKPSDNITIQDIINIFSSEWGREISKFKQDTNKNVIELIFETADAIFCETVETIDIEKKIVLSIAIRQKAERYMVSRINNDALINSIKTNQTRELLNMLNFDINDNVEKRIKEIMEKVVIFTSENIHINSFMYEPIIDMSLNELKQLYSAVKKL